MNGAPSSAIEQHRTYLLRYASLQLRDAGAAEDAVQDTLIAALEGWDRFGGKSSVKTWLTGILKHKIIDHLRRQSREQPLVDNNERSESDAVDALFKPDGHWQNTPGNWGIPTGRWRARNSSKRWNIAPAICPTRPPACS